MDKLTEIMAYKRREIRGEIRQVTDGELRGLADPQRPSFLRAIAGHKTLSVISEIKRKSPSAGSIAQGASAMDQATLYARSGADAISVLTDEKYFAGTLDDLARVTEGMGWNPEAIPCLRKDFFLHPIQVVEAGPGRSQRHPHHRADARADGNPGLVPRSQPGRAGCHIRNP